MVMISIYSKGCCGGKAWAMWLKTHIKFHLDLEIRVANISLVPPTLIGLRCLPHGRHAQRHCMLWFSLGLRAPRHLVASSATTRPVASFGSSREGGREAGIFLQVVDPMMRWPKKEEVPVGFFWYSLPAASHRHMGLPGSYMPAVW